MTKQEEIREGIGHYIILYRMGEYKEDQTINKILSYLHSQGVVIRVDRELTKEVMYGQEAYAQEDIERFLREAGYVAVEPLIEVKE